MVEAERHRTTRIIMMGPSLRVRGGVSSVARSLMSVIPASKWEIRYVATHVDGPRILKAMVAGIGAVCLLFLLSFWRPNIVHLHMASRASYRRKAILARLVKLFRTGLVLHVHGAEFHVFYDKSPPSRQRAITRTLESADLVIALSDEWKRRLTAMAPRAEIRVLMNPVVCDEFAGVPAERAPVPDRGGTVLFLGAFGKRKGTFDLIEAGARVAERRPNVVFELGGDQAVNELRALIDERGLHDNVRILGWIRGEDKLDAFRRAHVFALPSYHEGLPIAVLEALAAGLPLVTTPVGGIPEVIENGVNGVLIEPGDVEALAAGLLRLLDDEDLRRRMAETNVRVAREDHDASVVARTLCLWYDEIVARRSDAPPRARS